MSDICHHDMTDDWKKWKALSNTQRLNYSYSCTFVWLEGSQYCWRGKRQWWKQRSQPNSIQRSHRASLEPPSRMEWGRSAKSQSSWNKNIKNFQNMFYVGNWLIHLTWKWIVFVSGWVELNSKKHGDKPDRIKDSPCSCPNLLCDVHPWKVEEGDAEHGQHKPDTQAGIVSQLRKSVKILQIKRSHRHSPGQIHQWSLQKGRLGREPSPQRRASSQREQEVWRGWQNLSQRNNDESDKTL